MKRLLLLSLIFFATTAYAGTPLESTAVNQSLKSMLSTTGKWKRILVEPGSEAQVRSDLGVAESGTNTSITSLTAHESGTITVTGNIKLNGNYLSNDGGNEGISIGNDGLVTVGSMTVSNNLKVDGAFAVGTTTQGYKFSAIASNGWGVKVDSTGILCGGTNNTVTFGHNTDGWDAFRFTTSYFNTNGDGESAYIPRTGGAAYGQTSYAFTGDTDTGLNGVSENVCSIQTGGENRLVCSNTNIGINTTSFGTGTGMLAIANGTVTGMSAIANQGQIFCEGGELKAMDGSGNITPFSPHSELDTLVTNLADPLPHTYVSTNSYLGKKKIVNMALLIEEIERLSGKTLVTYEDVPLRDWATDQDSFRAQRDLERLKVEARIDEINSQIGAINNQLIISVVSEKEKAQLLHQTEDLQLKKIQLNKTIPQEYIPQHPPKWMRDRGVTLDL